MPSRPLLSRCLLPVLLAAVCALGAAPASAQPTALTASDADANDRLGSAVSLSADRALVGARGDDDSGANSGSAYVFVRDGDTWPQEAKLTADDGAAGDSFGGALALSGDRALVGSARDDDDRGAAYVFVRDGDTWTQEAKLTAADGAAGDSFGASVSLSGDRALVGSYADDDGAFFTGSAYVFVRDGDTWTQEAKLTAPSPARGDGFGAAVSLHDDRALVGTPQNQDQVNGRGTAYVFVRAGSTWSQETRLDADDAGSVANFGAAVSLSGDRALIGATFSGTSEGAAYVFARDGSTWTQETRLSSDDGAAGDSFGASVALSEDRALVGSVGDDDNGAQSGSAYTFIHNGAAWAQEAKLIASGVDEGDRLGTSVALLGDRAFVGAPFHDGAEQSSGSAYLFSLPNPTAGEDAIETPVALSHAVPNPASRRTTLVLTLAAPERIRATLVDALGREVAVLLDGEAAGTTRLGVDTSALAPGVYIVRVTGDTFVASRRLTVVR